MNVTEAAQRWEAAKREEKRIKTELETTSDVLKEWFRKSGKQKRGNVGYAYEMRHRLDTKAARAFILEQGAKIDDFEVESPRETLSLLS